MGKIEAIKRGVDMGVDTWSWLGRFSGVEKDGYVGVKALYSGEMG